MTVDWLWDKKIGLEKAIAILKNENHPRFKAFAALLFARKNSAREVFKTYITPEIFYKNWAGIKKEMRKDNWSEPRIIYWQAIYEKLAERYKGKISIRKEKKEINPLCKKIGDQLIVLRRGKKLTQSQLAKKIGISQQLLSRIEKGQENVSLSTLQKIGDKLKLSLHFEWIV